MNAELLKFAGDKLVPLILIGMAAGFYKLGLPHTFSGAVGGAGLLAFQISTKLLTPSQSSPQ